MDIKEILKTVFLFGKNKEYIFKVKSKKDRIEKYFQVSTIAKLDKSCCENSKINVIDFDKTKNIICAKNGWETIKSCDALKFVTEKERIDLIEMKSTKNLEKNKDLNKPEKIKEQIEKFNFVGKIRDSLFILSSIIQTKNLLSGEAREKFHEIKKQPIFLTDVDFDKEPVKGFDDAHEFLAKNSTDIKKLIKDEVNNVEPNTLNNLQQPKLMDCKTFETYYKP